MSRRFCAQLQLSDLTLAAVHQYVRLDEHGVGKAVSSPATHPFDTVVPLGACVYIKQSFWQTDTLWVRNLEEAGKLRTRLLFYKERWKSVQKGAQ